MHEVARNPHHETHFQSTETVRDVVIGLSDGLTVPFALAAGLSRVAASHIVVVAGLAEIAAGSIAMGLGGYLAARSDAEHYASERRREERRLVVSYAYRQPFGSFTGTLAGGLELERGLGVIEHHDAHW